jgi:hypothetical protein
MTEEHQQKAPPAFMARLIDPDAQKPVKEVEIALASWQKDLWTALGIPPNSPLRKLAVIGSGATMVCRDRSAEKARGGLGQVPWPYNRKATHWSGHAVHGPAVWVLTASSSGSSLAGGSTG